MFEDYCFKCDKERSVNLWHEKNEMWFYKTEECDCGIFTIKTCTCPGCESQEKEEDEDKRRPCIRGSKYNL